MNLQLFGGLELLKDAFDAAFVHVAQEAHGVGRLFFPDAQDVFLGLARLQARFMELLPGKPLTRDQLLMLQRDNVVGPDMPGLKELGIVPTPLELVVPTYLRRFQPGGGKRRVLPEEPSGHATDLSAQTRR